MPLTCLNSFLHDLIIARSRTESSNCPHAGSANWPAWCLQAQPSPSRPLHSARVGLSPIPSRHRSNIASVEVVPCHCCVMEVLLLLMIAGESRRMQVQGHLKLRIWSREKRRQADRRGSGLGWGKQWRVHGTPALAYGRDKRCVFHHTSKVRPFLFLFLGVSLFHVSYVLLGDLTACTPFLFHMIRRGGCRQRDAPLDPLPLYASCLCSVCKTSVPGNTPVLSTPFWYFETAAVS